MRVLFTTTGDAGHLLPLVPIARACMRAGHDVSVATQRSRADGVRDAGLPVFAFDDPPDRAWAPIMAAATHLTVEEANALVVGELFADIDTRAALPALLDLVERWRPTVIVRETYEFAGALAAEVHGIPQVRVGLGLARTEEWAIDLARPALDGLRTELGLPADPDGLRIRTSAYLTPVPAALEDPAMPGPLGAVRYRLTEPNAIVQLPRWWPDDDLPLVYLTFGSVTGGIGFFPRLYQQAIDALATLPIRLLVTTGHASDPRELGHLPPNVHAEQWVEQDHVYAHAAAVVGHGGFGTTLGALAHGVPIIMLPLFASDQWQLAHRVAQTGAGIALPANPDPERRAHDAPGDHVVHALARNVRRLIEHPGHRGAARSLADTIISLPPVEITVDLLEALSTEHHPTELRSR